MDGLTAHHQSLRDRHAQLEQQIAEELKRPHPDDVLLHTLKKQKLRIKEEIELVAV